MKPWVSKLLALLRPAVMPASVSGDASEPAPALQSLPGERVGISGTEPFLSAPPSARGGLSGTPSDVANDRRHRSPLDEVVQRTATCPDKFGTANLQGRIIPPRAAIDRFHCIEAIVRRINGTTTTVPLIIRLDTGEDVDYWLHGGILPLVWRDYVSGKSEEHVSHLAKRLQPEIGGPQHELPDAMPGSDVPSASQGATLG
ncbi:hypothetical protein ACCC97_18250 [Variovorax sp. Varisp85]|uniref:hypothetical protein n=1 Tax=Variovorax sp. Varisp85 TaxID=3243059 RepID=UPI001AE57392